MRIEKKVVEQILSKDGEVFYHGSILSHADEHYYFTQLLNQIPWTPDTALIFGKLITTRRKTAWYADLPFVYTYSKIPRQALPWTSELLELKKLIEQESGETYNSCLLNLYHDGSEGMGWHSDGEKDLLHHGAISSLSLGAARPFAFKHKQSKEVVSVLLAAGSLLVMKGSTQTHWLHRLPPTKKIQQPRINLTFRTMINFPK